MYLIPTRKQIGNQIGLNISRKSPLKTKSGIQIRRAGIIPHLNLLFHPTRIILKLFSISKCFVECLQISLNALFNSFAVPDFFDSVFAFFFPSNSLNVKAY